MRSLSGAVGRRPRERRTAPQGRSTAYDKLLARSLADLDNDELMRIVRGITAVERATSSRRALPRFVPPASVRKRLRRRSE
jgi:hypothetical protein